MSKWRRKLSLSSLFTTWFCFERKSSKKDGEEQDNEEPAIEEELEVLKTKIEHRTPLTPELFLEWKRKKLAKKERMKLEALQKSESDKKKGSKNYVWSGFV